MAAVAAEDRWAIKRDGPVAVGDPAPADAPQPFAAGARDPNAGAGAGAAAVRFLRGRSFSVPGLAGGVCDGEQTLTAAEVAAAANLHLEAKWLGPEALTPTLRRPPPVSSGSSTAVCTEAANEQAQAAKAEAAAHQARAESAARRAAAGQRCVRAAEAEAAAQLSEAEAAEEEAARLRQRSQAFSQSKRLYHDISTEASLFGPKATLPDRSSSSRSPPRGKRLDGHEHRSLSLRPFSAGAAVLPQKEKEGLRCMERFKAGFRQLGEEIRHLGFSLRGLEQWAASWRGGGGDEDLLDVETILRRFHQVSDVEAKAGARLLELEGAVRLQEAARKPGAEAGKSAAAPDDAAGQELLIAQAVEARTQELRSEMAQLNEASILSARRSQELRVLVDDLQEQLLSQRRALQEVRNAGTKHLEEVHKHQLVDLEVQLANQQQILEDAVGRARTEGERHCRSALEASREDLLENLRLAEQQVAGHERRGTELWEQLGAKRQEAATLKARCSAQIQELELAVAKHSDQAEEAAVECERQECLAGELETENRALRAELERQRARLEVRLHDASSRVCSAQGKEGAVEEVLSRVRIEHQERLEAAHTANAELRVSLQLAEQSAAGSRSRSAALAEDLAEKRCEVMALQTRLPELEAAVERAYGVAQDSVAEAAVSRQQFNRLREDSLLGGKSAEETFQARLSELQAELEDREASRDAATESALQSERDLQAREAQSTELEQSLRLEEQLAAGHERRNTELAGQLAARRQEIATLKVKVSQIPELQGSLEREHEALQRLAAEHEAAASRACKEERNASLAERAAEEAAGKLRQREADLDIQRQAAEAMARVTGAQIASLEARIGEQDRAAAAVAEVKSHAVLEREQAHEAAQKRLEAQVQRMRRESAAAVEGASTRLLDLSSRLAQQEAEAEAAVRQAEDLAAARHRDLEARLAAEQELAEELRGEFREQQVFQKAKDAIGLELHARHRDLDARLVAEKDLAEELREELREQQVLHKAKDALGLELHARLKEQRGGATATAAAHRDLEARLAAEREVAEELRGEFREQQVLHKAMTTVHRDLEARLAAEQEVAEELRGEFREQQVLHKAKDVIGLELQARLREQRGEAKAAADAAKRAARRHQELEARLAAQRDVAEELRGELQELALLQKAKDVVGRELQSRLREQQSEATSSEAALDEARSRFAALEQQTAQQRGEATEATKALVADLQTEAATARAAADHASGKLSHLEARLREQEGSAEKRAKQARQEIEELAKAKDAAGASLQRRLQGLRSEAEAGRAAAQEAAGRLALAEAQGAEQRGAREELAELVKAKDESRRGLEAKLEEQRREAESAAESSAGKLLDLSSRLAKQEGEAQAAAKRARQEILELTQESAATHSSNARLLKEMSGQLAQHKEAAASASRRSSEEIAEVAQVERARCLNLEAELQSQRKTARAAGKEHAAALTELEARLGQQRAAAEEAAEKTSRLEALAEASDARSTSLQARLNKQCEEAGAATVLAAQQLADAEGRFQAELAGQRKAAREAAARSVGRVEELEAQEKELRSQAKALEAKCRQEAEAARRAQAEAKEQGATKVAAEAELRRQQAAARAEAAELERRLADCREGASRDLDYHKEAAGRVVQERARAAAEAEAQVRELTRRLEEQRKIAAVEVAASADISKKEAELARQRDVAKSELADFAQRLQATRAHNLELEARLEDSTRRLDPCLGDPLRGVSIHHLCNGFLERVKGAGFSPDHTVHEVELAVCRTAGESLECPRDGKPGAAYVDTIYGRDHAGLATHLLSHTWDHRVGDIVEAMEDFCHSACLDPRRTYVWLGFLCGNWTRASAREAAAEPRRFQEFQEEFMQRIQGIGKVLSLVSPWQAPRCLSRLWCVAELCSALSLGCEACEVTMILPPDEQQRLRQQLKACNVDAIARGWRALQQFSLHDARTYSLEDREHILRQLDEDQGLSNVGGTVTRHLLLWFASLLGDTLQQLVAAGEVSGERAACLCDRVGWLLREATLYDQALELLQDGLQLSLQARPPAAEAGRRLPAKAEIAEAMTKLGVVPLTGWVTQHFGEHETPSVATLLMNFGIVRGDAGDAEGALNAFQRARRIRVATGTLHDSPAGAVLLNHLGHALEGAGFDPAAHKAFAEAQQAREAAGCLDKATRLQLEEARRRQGGRSAPTQSLFSVSGISSGGGTCLDASASTRCSER